MRKKNQSEKDLVKQFGKKEQGMQKKKLAPALVSAVGWGPMLAQCR